MTSFLDIVFGHGDHKAIERTKCLGLKHITRNRNKIHIRSQRRRQQVKRISGGLVRAEYRTKENEVGPKRQNTKVLDKIQEQKT